MSPKTATSHTVRLSIYIESSTPLTSRVMSGDYVFGLPGTILALEMVFFSGIFYYAYSVREYTAKGNPTAVKLGFFHAVLDALNPMDIVRGLMRVFVPFMPFEGLADPAVAATAKYGSSSDSDGMPQGNAMYGKPEA